MSIRHFIGSEETEEGCDVALMSEAQSQASDTFVLQRAKELLADLWKQGRIDTQVYASGSVCLAAALFAVEHPDVQGVTKRMGQLWGVKLDEREQEAKGREF